MAQTTNASPARPRAVAPAIKRWLTLAACAATLLLALALDREPPQAGAAEAGEAFPAQLIAEADRLADQAGARVARALGASSGCGDTVTRPMARSTTHGN